MIQTDRKNVFFGSRLKKKGKQSSDSLQDKKIQFNV